MAPSALAAASAVVVVLALVLLAMWASRRPGARARFSTAAAGTSGPAVRTGKPGVRRAPRHPTKAARQPYELRSGLGRRGGPRSLRSEAQAAAWPPAHLIPLVDFAAPPPAAAPYQVELFQAQPAFVCLLGVPGACDPLACAAAVPPQELAVFDSGWWPSASVTGVWLEWNADKGDPAALALQRVGRGEERGPPSRGVTPRPAGPGRLTAQGVSGASTTLDVALFSLPALPLVAAAPAGGSAVVDFAAYAPRRTGAQGGCAPEAAAPLLMAGQLTGRVGAALPRSLLTYDFLATFGVVLSAASRVVALYPGVAEGTPQDAHARALADFPGLGPLAARSAAATAWGLMLTLLLDTPAGPRPFEFLVDTGAIGVTLMVTAAAGAALGCYDPPAYAEAQGTAALVCAPLRRACVVDSAGRRACVAVAVGGVVTGCPGCAGRVGTGLLGVMDVFVARAGGWLASAYAFSATPEVLAALECASIQCPAPCRPKSAPPAGRGCVALAAACPACA